MGRYKFESFDDGFRISGEDRVSTLVKLKNTNFDIITDNKKGERYTFSQQSLVSGHKLIHEIAGNLMLTWESPKKKHTPKNLRKWAINNTKKRISKFVAQERLRLCQKADPVVYGVQKAVFAAAGKVGQEVLRDNFYTENDKYYLSDITKYRAAALTTFPEVGLYKIYNNGSWTSDAYVDYNETHKVVNEDWKKLYAFGGETYTSLNKTLTKFPGGIPLSILANLRKVKLERPIYSRRELLFLLFCVQNPSWPGTTDAQIMYANGRHTLSINIAHILQHASTNEINRVRKLLEVHLHQKINLRKSFEMINITQYIMDAAPYLTHNGNIVGLTEKAIEWHRNAEWGRYSQGYSPTQTTALPAIPLPNKNGVRFLATVEDIVNESVRMHHCVATYISQAVKGKCHLFSIEKDGNFATAEIGPVGTLRQIKGPYNESSNKAITYGRQVFSKWCKDLSAATEKDNRYFIHQEPDVPF
jgi:hypothetical protein